MTTVSSIVSAPITYTKVPFDVDRELTFVSQIATVPMIFDGDEPRGGHARGVRRRVPRRDPAWRELLTRAGVKPE